MNKPKFSVKKAEKAVMISSKIEGHKIPRRKSVNRISVKSESKS